MPHKLCRQTQKCCLLQGHFSSIQSLKIYLGEKKVRPKATKYPLYSHIWHESQNICDVFALPNFLEPTYFFYGSGKLVNTMLNATSLLLKNCGNLYSASISKVIGCTKYTGTCLPFFTAGFHRGIFFSVCNTSRSNISPPLCIILKFPTVPVSSTIN